MASSDTKGEVFLRPKRGGFGFHTKQPRCTGRVLRQTTDGTETGRVSDRVHTRSTHHRRARSPRRTPEGPARDNPIVRPGTGTTRTKPSVPASAGASGRHHDPGSQPASTCPAQPPNKSGGESSRVGKRHQGVEKANQSTESDRTRQGAAHHAGPQGRPERHAAGHNQGTRTGAKQQRPPGAANPESARNSQQTTAREQVPGSTSRRPDGPVRARQQTQRLPATEKPPSGLRSARPAAYPAPAGYKTAAVLMDVCAPGGYPAPASYETRPSGCTSARP